MNGLYAVFYRKSNGFRKLILAVKDEKIVIVSFNNKPELPKIRFENEKE